LGPAQSDQALDRAGSIGGCIDMTPAQHRMAGRAAMGTALLVSMFIVSGATGGEGGQKLRVEVDDVTFY
jgi:hypothetical protein